MRLGVWIVPATLVLGVWAGGCSGEKKGDAGKDAGLAELLPEETVILVAADKVDGQEDKVVANCGGCALGMPGKAEYALAAGDYEMHFCSEGCKTRFGADMHASIKGLQPSGQ